MKFLLKAFLITFTFSQIAMAGRMFDPEVGRFISRDPITNPQHPSVIMGMNLLNQVFKNLGSVDKGGYHDGMSLYNAYFAETFNTDPSGMVVYKVAQIAAGKLLTKAVTPPPKKPKHYEDCNESGWDFWECKTENKAITVSNKGMHIAAKKALKPVLMETTQYAIDSLKYMPTEDFEIYKKERIEGLETRLTIIENLIDPPYNEYRNCCICMGTPGFSGAGATGSWPPPLPDGYFPPPNAPRVPDNNFPPVEHPKLP